jgi:hypothetical protein
MKDLYQLYEQGWWAKVSPLARKEPECWVCSIYKRGKHSWITEQCRDFDEPSLAYEWAFKIIDTKTRQDLYT